MDIALVVKAKEVAALLTPFLPYLLKMGEKAAEEAGKKMGERAWEGAKALWAKLRPKVEAHPAAQEAVRDVAQSPKDPDAQAALRLQLKKILEDDPALVSEIAALFQDKVIQQVLASVDSRIENVEQQTEGGPTHQAVKAQDNSIIKGVKQSRKK